MHKQNTRMHLGNKPKCLQCMGDSPSAKEGSNHTASPFQWSFIHFSHSSNTVLILQMRNFVAKNMRCLISVFLVLLRPRRCAKRKACGTVSEMRADVQIRDAAGGPVMSGSAKNSRLACKSLGNNGADTMLALLPYAEGLTSSVRVKLILNATETSVKEATGR